MSRILGLSPTIHPERLNPEFIGIGTQFSEHKKERMQSDKYRKTITSNYEFTMKFSKDLQKNLQQKQKQLNKLQAIRERHHFDIKNKMQREHQRQLQLQRLKNKSTEQRNAVKDGIKTARDSVKHSIMVNKMNFKDQMHSKRIQFQQKNQEMFNQKCMRHQSIELGKKFGNYKINKFYREKNLQSYNNYLRRIKQQNDKSNENMNEIKSMNKTMQKLERKIQKKQQKLKDILHEIQLYSYEGQNDRKACFLATASAFRSNSMNTSRASRRQKPQNILRQTISHSHDQQSLY